jgi:hypothetical protein
MTLRIAKLTLTPMLLLDTLLYLMQKAILLIVDLVQKILLMLKILLKKMRLLRLH